MKKQEEKIIINDQNEEIKNLTKIELEKLQYKIQVIHLFLFLSESN